MKRMLLLAVSSSALALAAPGIASAHHHAKRHHRHGHHHAARARVLDFRASAAPTAATPTTGTPTTPASGETAGTVTSFKEGVLTITLAGSGKEVSGLVTEQTEIHCTTATPTTGGEDADDQPGATGSDEGGPSGEPQSGTSPHQDAHQASSGDDGEDAQQSSGDETQSCTAAALVPGALVREAELSISSAGAVWNHIDLVQ
jgi:hypothetical protein